MVKDSIVYRGLYVPCFFVSPVEKFNEDWLGYLQGCDPAAAYTGLCEYFDALDDELVTSASARFYVDVFTCMKQTFRERHAFRKNRVVAYLPDYVRLLAEEHGVVVEIADEADTEIRRLWLDKQIQIIREAM